MGLLSAGSHTHNSRHDWPTIYLTGNKKNGMIYNHFLFSSSLFSSRHLLFWPWVQTFFFFYEFWEKCRVKRKGCRRLVYTNLQIYISIGPQKLSFSISWCDNKSVSRQFYFTTCKWSPIFTIIMAFSYLLWIYEFMNLFFIWHQCVTCSTNHIVS